MALNLTRSLAFETDYVPWNAASGHLIDIGRLLSETIVYQPFSVKYLILEFVVKLWSFKNYLTKLGVIFVACTFIMLGYTICERS